jgi:Polysaccharide lyase
MSDVDSEAKKIAASGRTPEEHAEIAQSLETDPTGAPSVTLDFEGGNFDGWSVRRLARPGSAIIQDQIVRVGTKACRFEVAPGDYVSQGMRAELRDWYNAPLEAVTWYGFSTYLPKSLVALRNVGVVLAQWHDQAELGDPSGKPPVAIRCLDGALLFTGAFSEVASPDPEKRYLFHKITDVPHEVWLDFVFRILWSHRQDGRVDAFLNGTPLFSFEGPLGYRNQIKGPYFKLGVYASGKIDAPVVAYHDNYSRGVSYDEVDPSVLHIKPAGR